MNARYGHDPGLGFYTHVSDQHGPYSVRVMSATSHEAPYVLDGLMYHGTALRIGTHYTDTGGASDHVFILCAMLGFRFCPRLRDFPDRKLAIIEPATAYKELAAILGRRIRIDIIREHWDEILRLVALLQAGTVLPSAMLKRLAAYQRQNQLDLALQELGRIERTLFMLDWLESPELRQRCQAGGRLVVPDNISLMPLPGYSPQLNPIENVWAYLRGNYLIPASLCVDLFDRQELTNCP